MFAHVWRSKTIASASTVHKRGKVEGIKRFRGEKRRERRKRVRASLIESRLAEG